MLQWKCHWCRFFFFSDKESVLCEKQHGHYLSKCKQQTNDLLNKCEKLNQKIQQLKPRFDRCEQLLSDDMEVYESVGIFFWGGGGQFISFCFDTYLLDIITKHF